MRPFLCELALSAALVAGSAAMAAAKCPSVTASGGETAAIQLAQAGGGAGSSSSSGSAGSASPVRPATPGTVGSSAGTGMRGATRPEVIPPDTPMRQPSTPAPAPQPAPGNIPSTR
jgi:hypothetical protein